MSTTVDDRPMDVTCAISLDGEALAAYVTGRLGAREAEAFERHFFSCDECWALVRAAGAARTSFAGERGRGLPQDAPSVRAARRQRRWKAIVPAVGLAAAVAGVAVFGVWSVEESPPTGEVFRGIEPVMSLEAVIDGPTLHTRWSRVPDAAAYELRLYDRSGGLLRAAEVSAQALAVDLDMLELGDAAEAAALDVVALGGLGQVLLRSERVTLQP